MQKVRDILARKGKHLIQVSPGIPVLDALKIMAEKNIGAVLVLEEEKYLGILTERDYARKVILKGKSSAETQVKDIMSTGLPHITPENSIEDCMRLMSENNIRYLPVFEKGSLGGIVSINDLIRATILNQQETIDQLKNYIHS
ncbi:MAG: CBS domain-containing protein [Chitinophagaceae bacterium]